MSDITEDTTLVAASHTVSTDLDGEAVILDTAAGEYYGLNEVGTRIWTLLREPKTFGEVVDALLDEYRVDPDQCESEARQLVDQLIDNDLIEIKFVNTNRDD